MLAAPRTGLLAYTRCNWLADGRSAGEWLVIKGKGFRVRLYNHMHTLMHGCRAGS
jgi:hypothetical protein